MNEIKNVPDKSVMFSDFELVKKMLTARNELTARELAIAVTEFGIKWDKGQANSVLYKMLAKGLVEKTNNGGTRPIWKLPTKLNINPELNKSKLKVLNKNPKKDEFIPLVAVSEYSLYLNSNLIEFAVNEMSSANDPYISCDWLEDKIFVAINSKHPYISKGLSNNLILTEFLLFLALDAFCEWRIIKDSNLVQVHSFIEIKDNVLRTLSQPS